MQLGQNMNREEQYLDIYSFKRLNGWTNIAKIEGFSSSEEVKKKYKKIHAYIAEKLGLTTANEAEELYKNLSSRRKIIEDVHKSKWSGNNPNRNKRREGFRNDFKGFYQWYEKQPRVCFYCEIKEDITQWLFKNKVITSTKPSWTKGNLEVERKDGDVYNEDNCALACALCNNAKSDLISSSVDFKKYIAPGIRAYQEELYRRRH